MGTATAAIGLPPAISPAELADHRLRLTVLDVRTPAEFESVHIPGSFNVPLDQLAEHAEHLRDALATPVVLVCRSGMRATEAERALAAHDLPALHVLSGGLAAWEREDRPVRRGKRRWSIERQVRGAAGLLVIVGALGGLLGKQPFGALAAGVGGGLLVSALTDTCTMAELLAKLPYNQVPASDVGQVVARIAAERSVAADGAQVVDPFPA